MKAVYSFTKDPTYSFFLPITAWCWNKLGVKSVVFYDESQQLSTNTLKYLPEGTILSGVKCNDNNAATYLQNSRLYAAAIKDISDNEILVVSDIDMLLFNLPLVGERFTVFGYDLVPDNQYPMCYLSAAAKEWRSAFEIGDRTPQQCLDDALGHENCENMKGNLWCRDQETAFNVIRNTERALIARARPGTQWASLRVDRDDAYWRDRLTPDIIDAHLWRPGFREDNFQNIIELIGYFYPNDDVSWMIEYRNTFIEQL